MSYSSNLASTAFRLCEDATNAVSSVYKAKYTLGVGEGMSEIKMSRTGASMLPCGIPALINLFEET